MFDIILYIGLCVVGYCIAVPLRKYQDRLGWFSKVQTVAVMLLVFTMGTRIGANDEVIGNLGTYGLYALLFTVLTLVLSVGLVSMARRLMGIDRYGLMKGEAARPGVVETPETTEEGGTKIDRMTILILVFVAIGILVGYFVFRKVFTDFEKFNSIASLAIRLELCLLLTFVGLDLGLAGEIIDNFRKVGIRVLVIPAVTIIGTLLGALLTGLIIPLSFKECLGIGAGLGWYSLGAGMLMDAGLLTAGAISFMHNVMREMFSIILIPVVAKKIGYVETVAMPGAAAMDVCLPIVVRSTSANIAVYSFISGTLLSLAVPILVPLFL